MLEALEYVLRGLLLGVTYGLLAYPISLVFMATGTLDMAVGASAVLAGSLAAQIEGWRGMVAAVLVVTVVSSCIGLVSIALLRRKNSDHLSVVLATLGCAVIIESVVLTVFGQDPFIRQSFSGYWNLGGIRVSPQAGVNLATGLAMLGCAFILLYRTSWGRVMRASSINSEGAMLAGIQVTVTRLSAFMLSGVFAGIAGILILYTSGLSYSTGMHLTLTSLGAAILFGLGSPVRGFLGGITIGVVEALSVGFAPQSLGTVLPFVFIFAVLCTGKASRAFAQGGRP